MPWARVLWRFLRRVQDRCVALQNNLYETIGFELAQAMKLDPRGLQLLHEALSSKLASGADSDSYENFDKHFLNFL